MYATIWSKQRILDTHQAFLDLGMESPFDEEWRNRPGQDHLLVARIPVENRIRREALLSHVTQVDPESPFWFGLPIEVQDSIYPFEEYAMVRTRVPVVPIEDDLFAGLD